MGLDLGVINGPEKKGGTIPKLIGWCGIRGNGTLNLVHFYKTVSQLMTGSGSGNHFAVVLRAYREKVQTLSV